MLTISAILNLVDVVVRQVQCIELLAAIQVFNFLKNKFKFAFHIQAQLLSISHRNQIILQIQTLELTLVVQPADGRNGVTLQPEAL